MKANGLRSLIAGLGLSLLTGCSSLSDFKGYVLGKPVNEPARQADLRVARDDRNVVSVGNLGPGYFMLQTKVSGYSPSRDYGVSKPYIPDTSPNGLILFRRDF